MRTNQMVRVPIRHTEADQGYLVPNTIDRIYVFLIYGKRNGTGLGVKLVPRANANPAVQVRNGSARLVPCDMEGWRRTLR